MHRHLTVVRIRRRGLGAVLLISLFGVGCGAPKGEVSGTVSYQGKQLSVGNVTFLDANNQSVGSSPITAGKYAISKVPAGPVKILVTTPPPASTRPPKAGNMGEVKKKLFFKKGQPPADAPSNPRDPRVPPPTPVPHVTVPAKYGDPNQSDVTYDVQSGPQQHDIDLK